MRAPKIEDGPWIEILISPNGEVKTEVHGVTGTSCTAATDKFERGLGVVVSRTLKPEHGVKIEDKSKA
jgi:hypothetical protein